jgi:hypothetical protein
MARLTIEDTLEILGMTSGIAAGAARRPAAVATVEFQTEPVERIDRTMVAPVEEGEGYEEGDDEDENEEGHDGPYRG